MRQDRPCLIIDDMESALGLMTPWGRAVVEDGCMAVRAMVLELARRRNWSVVCHASYVTWGTALLQQAPYTWLVLDPLFPVDASDSAVRLRITRTATGLDTSAYTEIDRALAIPHTRYAILDDAAASGETLGHVVGQVRRRGASVAAVAVCAASRQAREANRPGVTSWHEYLPHDDWRILHLRDGCPFLPFTGRRCSQPPVKTEAGHSVELRVSTTDVVGSMWQVLILDSAVQRARRALQSHVIAALAQRLGRSPVIADVALLGPDVPCFRPGGGPVDAMTQLVLV